MVAARRAEVDAPRRERRDRDREQAAVGGCRSSEWWHVLEVNVLGVHLCCRASFPAMLERGEGRIVDHRQRRLVPPRHEQHGLLREQGSRRALRRDARVAARGPDPGLRDLAGPRTDRDDRRRVPRRRAVDAARARAAARPRARLGPLRRARRPLHPRGARPDRRAEARVDGSWRARSERDPPRSANDCVSDDPGLARANACGLPVLAVERRRRRRACGRPHRAAARRRRSARRPAASRTSAAIRPSSVTPRVRQPTAIAPGQSSAAQTSSSETPRAESPRRRERPAPSTGAGEDPQARRSRSGPQTKHVGKRGGRSPG